VAVVARLENQKKLTHAIRAFARVREQVPTARMDIYGKGASAQVLQREIDRLGLHEAVTLKGHDPHARDALWSASAFLMTSAYEGYPLSTLESMSHGCPVVSYDIKYGPREQITDGVDGFLVPSGDYRAMADRVVEMLRSPELVARMSVAATAKAARHDKAAFVRSWQEVLHAVVDLKPRRTTLDAVSVDAERVRVVPAGSGNRLTRRRVESGPLVLPQDELQVRATVRVRGHSHASDLSSARFSLAAVHEPTGHLHDLPVSVHRDGDTFTVTAAVPVADAVEGAPDGAAVQLRLQLVWENSTWQTFLARPQPESDSVEVSYDEAGTLRLQAVPGAGGAVS
jgi:poly(glycerol-phosphate) alpha-glucosyltransferase